MLAPLAAVAVLLVLWELVVQGGIVAETNIPPASAALSELVAQLGDGAFWSAVGSTLAGLGDRARHRHRDRRPARAALGFEPLGSTARSAPAIEFLRPIPSVALIPLAILVYGTGPAEQGLPGRVRVVLAAADPDDLRRARPRPGRDRHRALVRPRARSSGSCA